MTFNPHGKHLIAGAWIATESTFENEPAYGTPARFSVGTVDLVNTACEAAEEAFWSFGYSSRSERAAFLEAIASEMEARAADITAIGCQETGLPEARLNGERGRTTSQLRLFAQAIRNGDYLDRRHDVALPDREPLPRPFLRLMQRPVGPVAVFGASNFPLAFSVAGGDTAAALAAGCPVVVKGHSSHPGTGEIVAEAVHAAVKKCGVHSGVFSLVQGGKREVGAALVQHPLINAVGFTGSLGGGRALFDLCAQRPKPIPFFGELGSVNPMFILPEALKARGPAIARGWAASMTVSAGQLCTSPGIAVVPQGPEGDAFVDATAQALESVGPQVMLTNGMAAAYRNGKARFDGRNLVRAVYTSQSEGREVTPNLYEVSASTFLEDHSLAEEVFGPLGLIVRVPSAQEMTVLARAFEGQLTATIHSDAGDVELAGRLLPTLERKAGRVLMNGYPTGVEVTDAMVHGGPYPASTNFGATSVGTMSIRRFLRPVCYQNVWRDILPPDLV
ncbi:aldehyde dehydrogenase (NADP(+)) [Labrys sp. KNU-23]|uniref:aldehyde dehydrogenase (NADP(+)) n=1 Tax=Labrys sp. KNU-23 TaxID=2789216 RepID=UPI0011EF2A4E|nr:aldehyde dehydrogenase (NADP(+)) [Labrys sp. KNU-23]QEN85943.1 aldehyde dehydrogenase (NADP(+)) [Labrys sp. KNU-23]